MRQRKTLAAKRRVQDHALQLFADLGFQRVTVEQIAQAADVSPVSVYRWFGAKEGIVLWDEYDPDLFAAITANLKAQPPLPAVRDAVIAELGRIYDDDRGRVLARTQLIYREPALLSAAGGNLRGMQEALAEVFATGGIRSDLEGRVLAHVAVAALSAAIETWQDQGGRDSLAALVAAGFAALEASRWTT